MLLQFVMVAASPQFATRERLRDCDGRVRGRQTLQEYSARFNSWYLKLAHFVHNTETL